MAQITTQMLESGHSDVIHDVQMDYYGKRMATCSSDRTIKIFGVAGGQQTALAELQGHQGPVWQVAWAHPKYGSVLASCSYDRSVVIWKETAENTWVQAQSIQSHTASVNSICWAPHEFGLCLACASSDGSISILTCRPDGAWDTSKISDAHGVGVTSVSWSPAASPGSLVGAATAAPPVPRLASGGCDNAVKIWRYGAGDSSGQLDAVGWQKDPLSPLIKHKDWVRDVAWAPNLGLPKSTIASASQDGVVIIWTQGKEGEPWEPHTLHDFKAPVWRVSWSLTGNILAVSDANNSITLWKEAVDGQWAQVSTM